MESTLAALMGNPTSCSTVELSTMGFTVKTCGIILGGGCAARSIALASVHRAQIMLKDRLKLQNRVMEALLFA